MPVENKVFDVPIDAHIKQSAAPSRMIPNIYNHIHHQLVHIQPILWRNSLLTEQITVYVI